MYHGPHGQLSASRHGMALALEEEGAPLASVEAAVMGTPSSSGSSNHRGRSARGGGSSRRGGAQGRGRGPSRSFERHVRSCRSPWRGTRCQSRPLRRLGRLSGPRRAPGGSQEEGDHRAKGKNGYCHFSRSGLHIGCGGLGGLRRFLIGNGNYLLHATFAARPETGSGPLKNRTNAKIARC